MIQRRWNYAHQVRGRRELMRRQELRGKVQVIEAPAPPRPPTAPPLLGKARKGRPPRRVQFLRRAALRAGEDAVRGCVRALIRKLEAREARRLRPGRKKLRDASRAARGRS